VFAFSERRVPTVVREGVGVGGVVIVCLPFVKVVGDVVSTGVRTGVFKVDDDELLETRKMPEIMSGWLES
jgi:hypothetical protein